MIWPFASEIYFWLSMTGLSFSVEHRWPICSIFQSEWLVVSQRLQIRTERIHSSLVCRSSWWSECQRVSDSIDRSRSTLFASSRWFHADIFRKEAERLLLNPVNPRGTFLVRKSENAPGPYSLSVRDSDESRGAHVKHYKIRYPDANVGYFIAARRTFATLEDLIDYYTSKRSNLIDGKDSSLLLNREFRWSLLSADNRLSSTEADHIDDLERCLGSVEKFAAIHQEARPRNVRYAFLILSFLLLSCPFRWSVGWQVEQQDRRGDQNDESRHDVHRSVRPRSEHHEKASAR